MSFEGLPEKETVPPMPELIPGKEGSSLTPEQVEQIEKYFEEAEKFGLKQQRIGEILPGKEGGSLTPEQAEQLKRYLEEADEWFKSGRPAQEKSE